MADEQNSKTDPYVRSGIKFNIEIADPKERIQDYLNAYKSQVQEVCRFDGKKH